MESYIYTRSLFQVLSDILTFLNSCLSKRLHRIPFLPDDSLNADIMPRMRLLPGVDVGPDAPDIFTERVLRARLVRFWRDHSQPPRRGSGAIEPKYDALVAEERYETFCETFLPTVPPAFALAQPDRQWDVRLPALPMQRQLLHMTIYEILCWNFRPTLLQQQDQLGHLPGYKQTLVAHGKRALAVAALGLLESVAALHVLMGGSHTRFSSIILPNFEGAVPLLCLCADPSFPGDAAGSAAAGGRSHPSSSLQPPPPLPPPGMAIMRKTDPLGARLDTVSRAECMRAARGALRTLQVLAEVSDMADVGARTLERLVAKVDSTGSTGSTGSSGSSPSAGWLTHHVYDVANPSGIIEGGGHGGGGGDVTTAQQQQGVSEAVFQWALDPDMRDYAGGGGGGGRSCSQADFSFGNNNDVICTASEMALGDGGGGGTGVPNWEDVLRDITDNFGFEDIAGVPGGSSFDN